jgi:probable addiction module antidote protein
VTRKIGKSAPYKTSDYLKTKSDVIGYLDESLKDGEPIILLEALRDIARSKGGMHMLAKTAGVNRESLYRSLSPKRNPKFDTVMKIIDALGLRLVLKEKRNHKAPRA